MKFRSYFRVGVGIGGTSSSPSIISAVYSYVDFRYLFYNWTERRNPTVYLFGRCSFTIINYHLPPVIVLFQL